MYNKLVESAEAIKKIKPASPKVGITLGSGLGSFVDHIENQTIISYNDIPYFKKCSVEGHDGQLILGNISGIEVVAMKGRLHAYEGISMEEVVFPTRVLGMLGIENLILTNASGGISLDYKAGDIVMINDHINFIGTNPLAGPNIDKLGPRFPDMTFTYDKGLQEAFKKAANQMKYNLKSGVYAGVLGPTYETPAEIKMLRALGGDMVGMSTVPEAIAANHQGIKVGGLSCIANMAAGIEQKRLDHKDVKDQAIKVMETFSLLVKKSIENL